MEKNSDELKLTYSCLLPREKKSIVRVTFEEGNRYAEGIIPDGKIEKQKGFTKEEVEQLEGYLRENRNEIMEKAKDITGITHWLRSGKR